MKGLIIICLGLCIGIMNPCLIGQGVSTTMWEHTQRVAQDPGYASMMDHIDQLLMRQYLSQSGFSSRTGDSTILQVPIVFHILSAAPGNIVSNTRVFYALDKLNEAFRSTGFFNRGTGQDMHIEFCMAAIAPNGDPTNGIDRIVSPLANISSPEKNNELKKTYNWDPNRYLNIYVVSEISHISSGDTVEISSTSTFPADAGLPTDGITIRGSFIGISTTPEYSVQLIREIGHYLGLFSTFHEGCANDDCMLQGDRVCDTRPDHDGVVDEGCISQNNCTTDAHDPRTVNPFSADSADMNYLFMDQNDLSCQCAFTSGQRTRARAALCNFRSSLLSSNVCTVPTPYDAGLGQVLEPSLIHCYGRVSPQIELINYGLAPLTQVEIKYQLDYDSVKTVLWAGNIPYTGQEIHTLPSIPVSYGFHKLLIYTSSPNLSLDGQPANDTLKLAFTRPIPIQSAFLIDFEDGIPEKWAIDNPQGETWKRVAKGCDPQNGNEYCLTLDNQFFYEAGYADAFISPPIDLTQLHQASLSFDIAYGFDPAVSRGIDTLSALISLDCGQSFFPVPLFSRSGSNLATQIISTDTIDHWVPKRCEDWKTISVDIDLFSGQEAMIKFIYHKSDNGFPIYLDNIRIDAITTLPVADNLASSHELQVFPNPSTGDFSVQLPDIGVQTGVIELWNIVGQKVMEQPFSYSPNAEPLSIHLAKHLNGVFFLKVRSPQGTLVKKVVISK